MIARSQMVNHDDRPTEDAIVVMDATWADYQRLLRVRGERSVPRLTYREGILELMRPSRSHLSIKSIIGRLVEVWCLEHDIEFGTYGSWTLKDKELERGAEPDECCIFGASQKGARPHLAIEVVWTAGGINKLDVYSKLGVREVWVWRRGRITPNVLRRGKYVETVASEVLKGIDLEQLASFLDRPSTSQAIKAYRAALRR